LIVFASFCFFFPVLFVSLHRMMGEPADAVVVAGYW
jgi:hypothetical protein